MTFSAPLNITTMPDSSVDYCTVTSSVHFNIAAITMSGSRLNWSVPWILLPPGTRVTSKVPWNINTMSGPGVTSPVPWNIATISGTE